MVGIASNFHELTSNIFTIALLLFTLILGFVMIRLFIGFAKLNKELKKRDENQKASIEKNNVKKEEKVMSVSLLPVIPALILSPVVAWVLCLVILLELVFIVYAKVETDNIRKRLMLENEIKEEREKNQINELDKEELPPIIFNEPTEEEEKAVAELVRETITVEEAREAIADEVAMHFVARDISGDQKKYNKKGIINIDTLSENFADDETVTLDSLLEKALVPKGTDYVKVLARGELSKKLSVEMHDFSSDAVKMIILTGGKVTKVN